MIVQDFHFDKWGIDCAVASSQKGFDLPPGLSFVALSEKAKCSLETATLPRYYYDYRKYIGSLHSKLEQPFTPAISLVMALEKALEKLLNKTLKQIVKEKQALRVYTEQKFQELGFELFLENSNYRGNVLVPVIVPQHLNAIELCQQLDEKYNFTVAGGMGAYLGEMMRIGILGDINQNDIDDLIKYLKEVIK